MPTISQETEMSMQIPAAISPEFASDAFLCYTPCKIIFRRRNFMKRRRDRKKLMVRIVAIAMAALLVLGTMYSLLYYILW